MFVIRKQSSGQEVAHFETFEQADKFCGRIAYEQNYGIYRVWKQDGKTYMDCGPQTFVIEEMVD